MRPGVLQDTLSMIAISITNMISCAMLNTSTPLLLLIRPLVAPESSSIQLAGMCNGLGVGLPEVLLLSRFIDLKRSV